MIFYGGSFAAPAAGQGSALLCGFLFRVEKEPKDAMGWAQSAGSAKPLLPPCRPPPRTPITGDAYLTDFTELPARKI